MRDQYEAGPLPLIRVYRLCPRFRTPRPACVIASLDYKSGKGAIDLIKELSSGRVSGRGKRPDHHSALPTKKQSEVATDGIQKAA